MTDNELKLSVLVPNYNGGRYISTCLESIRSQSYKNVEILVIDANSTDNSHALIRAFAQQDSRVHHLIDATDRSLSDAINIGIQHATGDYAIWLGSDDYFNDSAVFADFVGFITDYNRQNHLKAAVCFGSYKIHWQANDVYEEKRRMNWHYHLLPITNILMCGNVFFDVKLCQHHHIRLPDRLKYSMDYDLWLQIYSKTKARNEIVCLENRFVYVFMMRSDNITGGSLTQSNIECRNVALAYATGKPTVQTLIYGFYYAQLLYQQARKLYLRFA